MNAKRQRHNPVNDAAKGKVRTKPKPPNRYLIPGALSVLDVLGINHDILKCCIEVNNLIQVTQKVNVIVVLANLIIIVIAPLL